jgi:hypothetical protein
VRVERFYGTFAQGPFNHESGGILRRCDPLLSASGGSISIGITASRIDLEERITMSVVNYYKLSIVSESPAVSSQLYSVLNSSELDDENTSELEYDLFDCCEELEILSLKKTGETDIVIEYESLNSWEPHEDFVNTLKRFEKTTVTEIKSEST